MKITDKFRHKIETAQKYLRYGSNVTYPLSKLTKKSNILEIGGELLKAAAAALDLDDIVPSSFNLYDWKYINSGKLDESLAELVETAGTLQFTQKNDFNERAHTNLYKIDDVYFAIREEYNAKSILVRNEIPDSEIYKILGKLIWTVHGPNIVLEVNGGSDLRSDCSIRGIDINPIAISSEKSESLQKSIEQYINLGINRSVILLGPPGTGKTTVSYDLAKKNKEYSVTLKVHSSYSGITTLSKLANILKPNVIIIDDLDRMGNLDSELNAIVEIKKATKLFIATMNSVRSIPKAVLRPGRFDEILEITTIGGQVLQKVAKDIPKSYFEKIEKWPIAFVEELNNRSLVVPSDKFHEEYIKLEERVKLNKKE